MTPVAPSAMKAIIPPAGATFAEAIRLVNIEFPQLVYTWFNSVHDEDGNFTNTFAQSICDVRNNCPDP